jgi:hypothetical protein
MLNSENHSQFWAIGLGACCLCSGTAAADFKAFAHIYPYFTQPEGGREIEVWSGLETADLSNPSQTTLLEEQIEIEYGLTNHWDVSLYGVLQEAPIVSPGVPSPLTFDRFQVETRYRFAEKGLWPVDTEVYAEIERPVDLSRPFELETKLILAKDIHHFYVQANLIDAENLVTGTAFGYDLGLNLGVGYEIRPWIRVGVEGLENYQMPSVNPQKPPVGYSPLFPQETIHIGPSVAVASSRLWFVVTPAFRVYGSSDIPNVGNDMRFLAIVGLPLD